MGDQPWTYSDDTHATYLHNPQSCDGAHVCLSSQPRPHSSLFMMSLLWPRRVCSGGREAERWEMTGKD